jgi:transcriptional regulator with XRE-family HTH domain
VTFLEQLLTARPPVPEPHLRSLSSILIELRRRLNLSQMALSRALRLPQSYVAQMETGDREALPPRRSPRAANYLVLLCQSAGLYRAAEQIERTRMAALAAIDGAGR